MSCPDCFSGHLHHGHLAGKETTVQGLPAYVTEPPEGTTPKGLIVTIPDAFGWATSNVRLVADTYAKRTGCRVYVPDFMNGTGAPAWIMPLPERIINEGGLWGWFVKPWLVLQAMYGFIPFAWYNMPGSAYKKVSAFMDDFRCNEGASLPVGAVGFCWGGYMVTQLAHGALAKNGKPLVDAVFTGHPSALGIPADIEKIQKPYSVAIGDVDFALGIKSVNQMQEILEGKKEVESEVVVLPGAHHGFAVRGDPNNAKEMEQADQAEDQCVRWFAKHLI